jgi:hypothetical protein
MITHDANFNTAIQALILIYQVASTKQVRFAITITDIDRIGSILSNIIRITFRSAIDDLLKTSALLEPPLQIAKIRHQYTPRQGFHQTYRAHNINAFPGIYLWCPRPPI